LKTELPTIEAIEKELATIINKNNSGEMYN